MRSLHGPGAWLALVACVVTVVVIRLLPMTLDGAEARARHVLLEEHMLASAAHAMAVTANGPAAWLGPLNEELRARLADDDLDQRLVPPRTEALRAHWQLQTADGGSYPYPADVDTFLWLRNARNLLEHGSVCDLPAGEGCRNALGLAPTGHEMIYHQSLHTLWLAAFHRLVAVIAPGLPLEFTGQFAVILVAVGGVVAAFMLGLRLVGNLPGAMNGAVIGAVFPVYLLRSRGLDNDVWNVVLPLLALLALERGMSGRRLGLAGWLACALVITAQAWVWAGWVFMYLIVLATLGVLLVAEPLRRNTRGRRERLGRLCTGSVVMLGVPWALISLTGLRPGYTAALLNHLPAFRSAGPAVDGAAAAAGGGTSFPRTLDTVAELADPALTTVVASAGHPLYLQLALLGLILLMRFRGLWDGTYWIVVCGALVLYGAILSLVLGGHVPDRMTMVLALAAPVVVAGLVQLRSGQAALAGREAATVALALWLLGAFYLSLGGVRFLLLLAAPLGLGIGLAIGMIYRQVLAALGRHAMQRRWLRPAAATVALLPLVPTLVNAWGPMRQAMPTMSDSWWLPLEYIAGHAPDDAIVTTQWSHGYFTAYVARRATPADGGVLNTHHPYWVDRALASDDPAESLGILRMLHCGGDAWPLPEGRRGGYGLLRASGRNSGEAHSLLLEILPHTREDAAKILAQAGLGAPAREAVLEATHCQPRPGYLVVSTTWLRTGTPLQVGLWSPERGRHPDPAPSQGLANAGEPAPAPGGRPATMPRQRTLGYRCLRGADEDSLVCPVPSGRAAGLLMATPGEREDWQLLLHLPDDEVRPLVHSWVARVDGTGVTESGTPDIGGMGTVIDLSRDYIWYGPARTLTTLFARLAALGGHQVPWASRVYEFDGPWETVSVWRIEWP